MRRAGGRGSDAGTLRWKGGWGREGRGWPPTTIARPRGPAAATTLMDGEGPERAAGRRLLGQPGRGDLCISNLGQALARRLGHIACFSSPSDFDRAVRA